MEKSDKPKETSPEKKFIKDTLQKEQTGMISKTYRIEQNSVVLAC